MYQAAVFVEPAPIQHHPGRRTRRFVLQVPIQADGAAASYIEARIVLESAAGGEEAGPGHGDAGDAGAVEL